MSVSAIVINYHTAALLPDLCSSLKGQDFLRELIVVSNSDDNIAVDVLEKKGNIPVRLVKNKFNKGFGAAVNQVIPKVRTEFLLIINPDARLLPGCIRAMVEVCRQLRSPLAGPRFYWDDQKRFRLPPATGDCLWLSCAGHSASRSRLDADLFSFYWILRHDRFWSIQEPFFEPFLSGACLMIATSWIKEMNHLLFDERFVLYYEDTDLCVTSMDRGIRPLCVPDAEVIHYWNQSPEPETSKSVLMKNAQIQFMEKYYRKMPSFPENMQPDSGGREYSEPGQKNGIPVFSWESNAAGGQPLYFEFGLTPYFVPFAQARVEANEFTLPLEIWKCLSPGRYYFRLRSPSTGLKKIWKWIKK